MNWLDDVWDSSTIGEEITVLPSDSLEGFMEETPATGTAKPADPNGSPDAKNASFF